MENQKTFAITQTQMDKFEQYRKYFLPSDPERSKIVLSFELKNKDYADMRNFIADLEKKPADELFDLFVFMKKNEIKSVSELTHAYSLLQGAKLNNKDLVLPNTIHTNTKVIEDLTEQEVTGSDRKQSVIPRKNKSDETQKKKYVQKSEKLKESKNQNEDPEAALQALIGATVARVQENYDGLTKEKNDAIQNVIDDVLKGKAQQEQLEQQSTQDILDEIDEIDQTEPENAFEEQEAVNATLNNDEEVQKSAVQKDSKDESAEDVNTSHQQEEAARKEKQQDQVDAITQEPVKKDYIDITPKGYKTIRLQIVENNTYPILVPAKFLNTIEKLRAKVNKRKYFILTTPEKVKEFLEGSMSEEKFREFVKSSRKNKRSWNINKQSADSYLETYHSYFIE